MTSKILYWVSTGIIGLMSLLAASIGVQQKLMRHADIRTTMNIYGDAATEDMKQAHSKVVRMVLSKLA